MLERINKLEPYAFYIVDTLGVMYEKDLIRQVFLVDNNLKPSISLGYHSHNNFQLAFSNAQALSQYNTKRNIIIDCSANGMGRGAGNLCSELFMDYLNRTFSKNYDVLPVLEIVAIGSILKQIPQKEKRFFNKALIEKIYQEYQSNAVDDIEILDRLRKKLDGRNVLVISPGSTVKSEKGSILKYISKKKPFVISVNFIPDYIKPNIVFVGNSVRYSELEDRLNLKKTVFTSNIKNLPKKAVCINYSELINATDDASDSSGLMVLKLLKKASVKSVALAGYDGFTKNPLSNYISKNMCGAYDPILLKEKNLAISKELKKLKEKMKIKFVTTSIYDTEKTRSDKKL